MNLSDFTGIQMDSRRIKPGNLFVCWPGLNRDSHSFLPDAKANGAVGAIVYSEEGRKASEQLGFHTIQWPVTSYPDRAWRLCDEFFDHPTRTMKVVGITGTNGKTTVAWLLADALSTLGLKSAYLGTLGFKYPGANRELPNTTPFAIDLYNLLAEARDAGVEALAMEISSHALAEKRADGVEIDVAVFTNLTQDHLDFHGNMDRYSNAKWRLFTDLKEQSTKQMAAVFNLDDPIGKQWHSKFNGRMVSFSLTGEKGAAIQGSPSKVALGQLEIQFEEAPPTARESAAIPLGGDYNVENSVAAVAVLRALGFSLADSVAAMEKVHPVPGRFEPVKNNQGKTVIVDYAHTPDALTKLLEAIRKLTRANVITVFGCGGDRDRAKRPLMAAAASAGSDYVIATSDNPRTEDPTEILRDIQAGLAGPSDTILDRREAIHTAIKMSRPGDTVVIAGKGHENYQIIGREKTHFDDREVASEALA